MKTAAVLVLIAAGCAPAPAGSHAPVRRHAAPPRTVTERAVSPPHASAARAPIAPADPAAGPRVRDAIAVLQPTRDSHVTGTVRFRETGDGLEVLAALDALPNGVHAYGIHAWGDCSAPDAASAGPRAEPLGHLRDDGRLTTTHRAVLGLAGPGGLASLVGRAVVIHAHAGDPSAAPSRTAPRRLACGVIGIAHAPTGAASDERAAVRGVQRATPEPSWRDASKPHTPRSSSPP